jgi:hypothetical protein
MAFGPLGVDTHSCKSSLSNTFSRVSLGLHMSSYNSKYKGSSCIHVSKSLDPIVGKNLITLVVHPMHNPYFYSL